MEERNEQEKEQPGMQPQNPEGKPAVSEGEEEEPAAKVEEPKSKPDQS